MKRFLLLFLFVCAPAFAQSTSVTGQAVDSAGQAFAGGTYQFTFFPAPSNPTAQYFWNGVPFNKSTVVSGQLDGSGSFTVSVPSNTSITPAQSKWVLTVSPASSSQGTQGTPITITGTTQNVTSTITPPAIQVAAQPRVAAYRDSEIVGAAPGFTYSNLTDSEIHFCQGTPCTWIVIGGGGGGSGPPFLGPNPWFDVTNAAYGAKCDGVTDDTASFQAAFNAAGAAPGGTVYIPWNSPVTLPITNQSGCVIKGGITKPSTSDWINVLQVGNITIPSNATAPLLSGVWANLWWLGVNGQGAGAPQTFGEPSAPTILNYSNFPTLHLLKAGNVRFENLDIRSFSATADGVNFFTDSSGGFVGVAFINVNIGMNGGSTGVPLNLDCSITGLSGNGCFNIKVIGGNFTAASTATQQASIVLYGPMGGINIGDPNRRMLLGGYGILIKDNGSNSGTGLADIQNILTEALTGPVITASEISTGGSGGSIAALSIHRVDLADCIGTCSIFKATSAGSLTIKAVSVENSSGGNVLDTATNHLQGFITQNNFEVNDATTIPASADMLIQEAGIFSHYAANNAAGGFNQVRGHSTFGCLEPSGNGANMLCDPLNGDAGFNYSSLPGGGSGATGRDTSAAADAFHTFESPAGTNIFQLLFCKTGGGCPGAVNYQHGTGMTLAMEGHSFTFPASSGVLCTTSTCSGAVSSVFGRSGAVIAAASDYNFNQLAGQNTYAQLPTPSTNGDVICSTGGAYAECTPGRVVTNETGSGAILTFAQSDNNKLYTQANASASTYVLPIVSSLSNGWSTAQLNTGAGTATTNITTSTATVCRTTCATAQTSYALATGEFALVYSNSTGYFVKIW